MGTLRKHSYHFHFTLIYLLRTDNKQSMFIQLKSQMVVITCSLVVKAFPLVPKDRNYYVKDIHKESMIGP